MTLKGFETMNGGGEHRTVNSTQQIKGDKSTGRRTVAAFSPEECGLVNHIRVKLNLTEVDPYNPDDDIGQASLRFILNCEAIAAQAGLEYYTGMVENGLLPMLSGTLLKCGDKVTDPEAEISTFIVCRDGTVLEGVLDFAESTDPSDCPSFPHAGQATAPITIGDRGPQPPTRRPHASPQAQCG